MKKGIGDTIRCKVIMEKETSFDPDIFDAVEFDDLESVKMYWRNGINVDYQDLNGMTLLMYAVSYDHIAIIEYLLSKNPDLGLRASSKSRHPSLFSDGLLYHQRLLIAAQRTVMK